MVMRVTNQAQQANALRNIFRITEDQFENNQKLASGKRILKASDDPLGLRDVLSLRTSTSRSEQFNRNIEQNRVFINAADEALNSVGNGLIRAKELAVGGLSGINSAQTRQFAALEIETIIDEAFRVANSEVKGRLIFGGTSTTAQPFQRNAGGLGSLYSGNSDSLTLEIGDGLTVPVTRPGSDAFAVDLNPAVVGGGGSTLLADLNGGAGITLGSLDITDREGNNAVVSLAGDVTVQDVLDSINGAAGLNITASVNSAGNGILLTDTSLIINQSLTVAESGGGTIAADLGILGSRDGNLEGSDLNPALNAATLISDLNGGNGLTLGIVNIQAGGINADVDLSGATDIGDVITLINGFGGGGIVSTSINSQGNSLEVTSLDPNTAVVIDDVSQNTASILGIGGNNVFLALDTLRDALEKNDTDGILASLDLLDASSDRIQDARAGYGALSRTLDNSQVFNDSSILSETEQISAIEDTDVLQAASDLAALEVALQATLATSARALQPSLLDFLN